MVAFDLAAKRCSVKIGMIALVSSRIGLMNSQNPKISHIGRRVFLRILGARLGADYAKVLRKRRTRRRGSRGSWVSMAPGFAKHLGHLRAGLSRACIRHKLAARRSDRTVYGSC
jgi:hypothetical protein